MIDETGRKLQDKYRTDYLLPNRTTWTQIGHVRVGRKAGLAVFDCEKNPAKRSAAEFHAPKNYPGAAPR